MEDAHANKEALQKLRAILLEEDRSELEGIRNRLDSSEEFSNRVSPIIEERLAFFKKEFPNEFKTVIQGFVDERIESSQEEILNVIYPVMGKMIKKYIQHQFELLRESINQQIEDQKRRIFPSRKSKLKNQTGITPADRLLSKIDTSIIHEIYVIKKHSGILLGSYSGSDVIDRDALAGMLTAIKSFVEDAFRQDTQELEIIRYQNYQIFVYNLYTYYIAVAVEGSLSSERAGQLEEALMNIGEKINPIIKRVDESTSFEVRKLLTEYFHNNKE
ncbi:MAG: hypothetical protein AAGG68_10675 [Bacteroidota bacterium]